ncbi:MFS general substrate transporter [Patellaria atrata CBS 101060]|uniref:MFS general substrate transporter n=1 Tax=Patellaria atrata CBS 101060 TaxID=1346257 RepID=A0A9P4S2K0_9PEZI|nr:MFS general substrate transporter [Patellaria atrata CBS 101060]
MSSIQSYMFFQLKHFSPKASNATIASQSGILISARTASHVLTGLLWGRLADDERIGRKVVLVIGLLASGLAIIGYGFAETFTTAVIWQTLDGLLNGTIPIVRCMTAEIHPDRQYRARALALLPLCANAGTLLGPLIGGFLASRVDDSSFSSLSEYPYAVPNLCVAGIQVIVAICAILGLEDHYFQSPNGSQPEGHVERSEISNSSESSECASSNQHSDEISPLLINRPNGPRSLEEPVPPGAPSALPLCRMWTSNVLSTMIAQFIISGHLGTFSSLWAIFLSTPVVATQYQHPPLWFSGGLGLSPKFVGVAMSSLGFAGIILQIVVYPPLRDRTGTIRLWRTALYLFPVVYVLAPFCALVASSMSTEEKESPSSGSVWIALLSITILYVLGRTGVVPATSLLINDCAPHPSVRGTVHATGTIVSNLSRTWLLGCCWVSYIILHCKSTCERREEWRPELVELRGSSSTKFKDQTHAPLARRDRDRIPFSQFRDFISIYFSSIRNTSLIRTIVKANLKCVSPVHSEHFQLKPHDYQNNFAKDSH